MPKIEMGKKYQTRTGLPVEILTTTAKGLYYGPVVGLVQGFDGPCTWSADGIKNIHAMYPSRVDRDLDLLEIPEVIEGWVNLYPACAPTILARCWEVHPTRQAADRLADTNSRIACIPIKFHKGEGL